MSTIYDKVKLKLEQHTYFRERRKRAEGLMILTLRELGLEGKEWYTIENLIDISKKYDSYRHEWDAVTKDYENLRGRDWEDKERLEQEKIMSYGTYEVGYFKDIQHKV